MELAPRLHWCVSMATTMPLDPTQSEAAPLPLQMGDHRVLACIARGGMCAVYLGEHVDTGERVAVKALDPRWARHTALVRRLFDEYAISRRVPHRGLVHILDASSAHDGVPYLVMELIDGESLSALLGRRYVAPGAIAAIGAQIADAVASMHAAGIIHCDLKPDNVMVLYQAGLAGWPRIKVLDFGIARRADDPAEEIAGTPCYMAPEQWCGLAEPRSDVYGLGCLLYELIDGAPPFDGAIAEVAREHRDTRPRPPGAVRAVPPVLQRLVLRMLAKDPAMRPRMVELVGPLAELAFASPPGARTEDLPVLAAG